MSGAVKARDIQAGDRILWAGHRCRVTRAVLQPRQKWAHRVFILLDLEVPGLKPLIGGAWEPNELVETWDGRASDYGPMPATDGGADFTLVYLDDEWRKPTCWKHGAMNKVSDVFWRCISTSGAKHNPCRAGCMEITPPASEGTRPNG
jgi:hypothetical protein